MKDTIEPPNTAPMLTSFPVGDIAAHFHQKSQIVFLGNTWLPIPPFSEYHQASASPECDGIGGFDSIALFKEVLPLCFNFTFFSSLFYKLFHAENYQRWILQFFIDPKTSIFVTRLTFQEIRNVILKKLAKIGKSNNNFSAKNKWRISEKNLTKSERKVRFGHFCCWK